MPLFSQSCGNSSSAQHGLGLAAAQIVEDDSERIAVIAEDLGVIDVSEFSPERVKVVTPEESKGLEFDHSIVVSPADWYDGSTSMARTMYVVLTRATKSITILQQNIKRTGIKFLEI